MVRKTPCLRTLLVTGAALLATMAVSGAGCPSNPTCAPGDIPCGNGCIPGGGNTTCCETNGESSPGSSYCVSGSCYPNDAGNQCSACGVQTRFCCGSVGDIGSNDCPADTHHCGVGGCNGFACVSNGQACCDESKGQTCSPGSSGGGGGAGSTGGGGGADAGVGKGCVLNPDAVSATDLCCNGLTTSAATATNGGAGIWENGGAWYCSMPVGTPCTREDGNMEPGTDCCNTNGGLASIGTIGTQCYNVTTCTGDATCPVGEECYAGHNGSYCAGCLSPTICSCAAVGKLPSGGDSCCAGLDLTPLSGNMVCLLPSGSPCDAWFECASQKCLQGATTATCQ